jgi:hypothetical protein
MASSFHVKDLGPIGLTVLLVCFGSGGATNAGESSAAQLGDAGFLQFDSTIEQSSRSGQAYSALFVRYWVSAESYHVAVVWSEPHAGRWAFPGYPPTLRIDSSPTRFAIRHGILHELTQQFEKPIGQQSSFTNMYGDYSLPNISYAEGRFERTRLFSQDVETGIGQTNAQPSSRPRDIGALAAVRSNGAIESLNVFDRHGSQIGKARYEYESLDNQLRNVKVSLFQQPVILGLPGAGATVGYGNVKFDIKEFRAIDKAREQKIDAEYQSVLVGANQIRLPKNVVVTSADNEVLRKADFSSFQKIAFDESQIGKAANEFCGLNRFDDECRELVGKHWGKNPFNIPPDDVLKVKQLIDHYIQQRTNEFVIGEQLRRFNMLMELHRMVGDTEMLIFCYRSYLQMLADHKLNETLLVGGQSAIETLMLWGRLEDADRLLKTWLGEARAVHREVVYRFALRQLSGGSYWTSLKLLDDFGAGSEVITDFELVALRAVALNHLVRIYNRREDAPGLAQAQQIWLRKSMTIEDTRNLATQATMKTESLFKALSQPTPSQVHLLKQLSQ